jgi:hypothetical protein
MAKNLFYRYVWLVDVIYREGKITFEEINRKWLRTDWSEGKDLPLRTFHNHREAVQDIFDINIDCDRRSGCAYFIENTEDLERGNIRSWLLNTLTVHNLVQEGHHLKHRILFEEIPSGQRFLTSIMEAMRDNVAIEMTYQPFWAEASIQIMVNPYCLKIFRQRWYVVGLNAYKKDIRTYSLDRIQAMRLTAQTFKMPKKFSPKAYFEDCFGINKHSDRKPCVVKLKVFGQRRKYIQTLPLHASQEEMETAGEYSVFSYYVAPTPDLEAELLSAGIEVLSPAWLRASMAEAVREMSKRYE